MLTFTQLGLTWLDGIYIGLIGIGVFLITYLLYPPIIRKLIKAGWVGYDIHKVDRPKTAESGGIGCTLGMILGLLAVGIVFPQLWMYVSCFSYNHRRCCAYWII